MSAKQNIIPIAQIAVPALFLVANYQCFTTNVFVVQMVICVMQRT